MTLRIAKFDDESFGEFDPDLADAVRYGDLDRVLELLNSGAAPDAVDSRGEPLLLIALRYEHGEIASTLITHGASTDCSTSSGASPLWLASTLGLEPVVRALIDAGAEVNAATEDHSTPLSAALQAGHWSLADLLRQHGAVVLEQDAYHADMERSYAKPGFSFAAADSQAFRTAIAELQDAFGLHIAPLPDRPGIYTCRGDVLQQDQKVHSRVREMGYCLIYDQLSNVGSAAHWLLLPTDDKYPILREIGPYSDRSAADNQSLIWMLVDIEEDYPFELIGCGVNFVHGRLQPVPVDPSELAEHLMAISPETAKHFESVEKFSSYLATTGIFSVYC